MQLLFGFRKYKRLKIRPKISSMYPNIPNAKKTSEVFRENSRDSIFIGVIDRSEIKQRDGKKKNFPRLSNTLSNACIRVTRIEPRPALIGFVNANLPRLK